MKKFWDSNTSFILIFRIVCCFLSVVILNIETVIACDEEANCDGVEFNRRKFLTDESLENQREILSVLFDISVDDVDRKVFYDYNYYGDSCDFSPKWKDGCAYNGGHPGWDVQTQSKSKNTEQHFIYTRVPYIDQ